MTVLFGHFLFNDSSPSHRASREFDTEYLPRSTISAPHYHRSGDVVAGLTGCLRLEGRSFNPADVAQKILDLYLTEGHRFLSRLRGPFALAVADTKRELAILAVDRMGIESLCWSISSGRITFGTSVSQVARATQGTYELNLQAVYDFILGHVVTAPDTAYAGVHKLMPATYLLSEKGRVTEHRYWEPDFDRPNASDIAALQSEVLPTIHRAVQASQPEPFRNTGAFLSGGLDSSTVTGVLSECSMRTSSAFSVGFDADGYDELYYARKAVEHFGCPHFEYTVTANDIVDLVPRIAAAYDDPFGNSSAVPTFCCARLAQNHGISHLLAGDGGDELFGGNERYVRHKTFEAYQRVPQNFRRRVLEPLAEHFDPDTAIYPLRKLSSYVRQASILLPERFESWNLVYREGAAAVFDADLLSRIDPEYPLRKMRDIWESCPSGDLLDRMLWYDWKFTLADNDLRKVTRMCEIAGVKVSFPMLDEELIDLSIRVPSAAKIKGRQLRWFFKGAVRGYLPPEIIRKQKQGFGLPFGVWLKDHAPLQRLVYDNLKILKTRKLLSERFLDRMIAEHRQGAASYYGSAIWDLLMLEQWLQVNEIG